MRKLFLLMAILVIIIFNNFNSFCQDTGQTTDKGNEALWNLEEVIPGSIIVQMKSVNYTRSGADTNSLAAIVQSKGKTIKKFQRIVPDQIIDKLNKRQNTFTNNRLKTVTNDKLKDLYILEYNNSTIQDTLDLIKELEKDPNVLYAEPNFKLSINAVPDDVYYDELWGMDKIEAPVVWDRSTGSTDVIVAVIDTGVDYTHPDLAANMWINEDEIAGNGIDDDGNEFIDDIYGYDFCYDDNDPMDGHGHGTHCAGTIGAVGNNAAGVAGVNWNIKIMALKYLPDAGSGNSANAIKCIYYAIANGANIMSNSWGGGSYSQTEEDAIQLACDNGILFIAAAGNTATNNDLRSHYPSNYEVDNVIAVAASDEDDNLADFSNYGKESVDIAAPGVKILSTIPDNKYAFLSGTSMATPHVSGAAALLMAINPDWDFMEIKNRLLIRSEPIGGFEDKLAYGGRLNLYLSSLDIEDTELPIVIITDPPGDTIAQEIFTISGTASDNMRISRVDINIYEITDSGDLFVKRVHPEGLLEWHYELDTGLLKNLSSYKIEVVAMDVFRNNSLPSTVTIYIANETIKPVVNITSPADNSTHTGTLLITGTASDNKDIRKVELKLYEVTVGGDLYLETFESTDKTDWSFGINTVILKNFTKYKCIINAFDTSGNISEDEILYFNVGENTNDNLLMFENFDDGDVSDWLWGKGSGLNPIASPGVLGTDACLMLHPFDTPWYIYKLRNPLNPETISFYIKNSSAIYGVLFEIRGYRADSETNLIAGLYFGYSGYADDRYKNKIIIQAENNEKQVCGDYIENQWYLVEFKNINWLEKKFDIYIDGVQKMTNIGFFDQEAISLTYLKFNGNTLGDTYGYFDELRLTGSIIDDTPPRVTIEDPQDGTIINDFVNISGTASDNFSGIREVLLKIYKAGTTDYSYVPADGTTDWTYSFDTTLRDDQSHYIIEAYAYDKAGNLSREDSLLVYIDQNNTPPPVDQTPPTIQIISPDDGETLKGEGFIIQGKAADNDRVNYVEVILKESGIPVITEKVFVNKRWFAKIYGSLLEDMTTYSIEARAYDMAGNSSEPEILSINYQQAPDTILYNEDFENPDMLEWYTIGYDDLNNNTYNPGADGSANCYRFNERVSHTLPFIKPRYISFYASSISTTPQYDTTYISLGKFQNTQDVNLFRLWFYQGNLNLYTGKGLIEMGVYQTNTWYHFEFKNIDWENRTYDVYLDGVPIAKHVLFKYYNLRELSELYIQGVQLLLDNISMLAEEPVTDDTEPPFVVITNPQDNQTIEGLIDVMGTASDNVDVDYVTLTVFRVSDNQEVFTSMAIGTTEWSIPFDTTLYPDNSYRLSAQAVDTSGNPSSLAEIIIEIVNNAGNILFEDDFEDGSIDDWNLIYDNNTVISPGANSTNYCLDAGSIIQHDLANITPKYISFYVKSVDNRLKIIYLGLDRYNSVMCFILINGRMRVQYNGEDYDCGPYQIDTWYHVEFRNIDWTNRRFDVYIGGIEQLTDVAFRYEPSVTDLSMLEINGVGEACYDEIIMSSE